MKYNLLVLNKCFSGNFFINRKIFGQKISIKWSNPVSLSNIQNHINKNLKRGTLSPIIVTSRNAYGVEKTKKVALKAVGRGLENGFCDF